MWMRSHYMKLTGAASILPDSFPKVDIRLWTSDFQLLRCIFQRGDRLLELASFGTSQSTRIKQCLIGFRTPRPASGSYVQSHAPTFSRARAQPLSIPQLVERVCLGEVTVKVEGLFALRRSVFREHLKSSGSCLHKPSKVAWSFVWPY